MAFFFFRYIATAGNFHAGRPEHGYPKIRNPQLIGVACKHVVRVMGELESSPRFRSIVSRAINAARDKDTVKKRIENTQKAAEAAGKATPRAIRTSQQIAQRKALAKEKTALRTAMRTSAKAKPPKPKRPGRVITAVKAIAAKLGLAGKLVSSILGRFGKKK